MKKISSLLIFFLLCAAAYSQNKLFNESMLSENEKLLCTRFKALKGQDRYDIYMKLDHLFPHGIIKEDPSPSTARIENDTTEYYIPVKTLLSMLGEPDVVRQEGEAFDYILYSTNCVVSFFMNSKNEITFHGFANCAEKWNKEKK